MGFYKLLKMILLIVSIFLSGCLGEDGEPSSSEYAGIWVKDSMLSNYEDGDRVSFCQDVTVVQTTETFMGDVSTKKLIYDFDISESGNFEYIIFDSSKAYPSPEILNVNEDGFTYLPEACTEKRPNVTSEIYFDRLDEDLMLITTKDLQCLFSSKGKIENISVQRTEYVKIDRDKLNRIKEFSFQCEK